MESTRKTRRDSLLRANDSATGEATADRTVSGCGKGTQTFSLLLWNVRELGGGFYMAPKRDDHCVGACAGLLAAVNADICIITGLRRTDGVRVGNATTYLRLDEAAAHTGVSELARIVTELRTRDPGSDWRVAYASGGEDEPVYDGGVTTAILYRAAAPCSVQPLAFVSGPADPQLGIGPTLLHASLELTPEGGKAMTVDLLTPLGRAGEAANVMCAGPPAAFVAALSLGADVLAAQTSVDGLRSALGAERRAPLSRATVPGTPFWRAVSDAREGLLEDYTGVNAADVRLADGSMHWEALEPPDHPASAPMVAGTLQDAFFVRNGDKPRYVLRELRVVDLLRAGLTPAELAALGGDEDAVDEDAAFAAEREQHHAAARLKARWSVEADPANVIADCCEFAECLSDHWPLLATVAVQL